MSAFIDGGPSTVGGLFDGVTTYRIPGYQRPYAWPQGHALQLVNDIAGALLRGRQRADGGNYYIGNIILAGSAQARSATVVDGQQRLVTLTILLALLRDRGAGAGAGRAVVNDTAPRVVPRDQDAAFLWRHVQMPYATSQSAELAPEAADEVSDATARASVELTDEDDGTAFDDGDPDVEATFGGEVEDDDDDGHAPPAPPVRDSRRAMIVNRDAMGKRLDELARDHGLDAPTVAAFVLDRCHVIRVRVEDSAEAHRVFVVMHARGLDLSHADILKSEVLGSIEDTATMKACQDVWEAAEERLGRVEFAAILAHMRTLKLKSKPNDIFAELRAAYETATRPAAFVERDIAHFAGIYHHILEGTWTPTEPGSPEDLRDINRRLVRMSILPFGGWTPVAIRLCEVFASNAAALASCVRKLDALAFGLHILGERQERTTRFIAALRLLDEPSTAKDPSRLISQLTLSEDNRRGIARKLTAGALAGKPWQRNVLLRRLDAEHIQDIGPLPDYHGTTAEHVLPRRPGRDSHWARDFPDPKDYVQNIGNLIVIPGKDNGALGNLAFGLKKAGTIVREREVRGYGEIEQEHGFGMLPDVLATERWLPAVVDARRKRMEELLLSLWDLKRPDGPAPAKPRATKAPSKQAAKQIRAPQLGARNARPKKKK